MSDLINRQDVLDVLKNLAFDHIFQCGEYYGEDERQLTIINARKAIDVIEAMPSVEPEQTAKVTDNVIHVICCEKCERVVSIIDNYCPGCGAKLDWSKNDGLV